MATSLPPPSTPGVDPFPEGVHPDEIRASLEVVLTSKVFAQSRRLVSFLRFVVEAALEGRSGDLKEYLIGVEVFERKKSYDPRTDPIVRVEAGRLRKKLTEFYESEGASQTLRIDLPKGGYAPVFVLETPPTPAPPAEPESAVDPLPPPPVPPPNWRPILFAIVPILALAASAWWSLKPRPAPPSIAPQPAKAAAIVSIAVLPFADLSPKKDQAYFSAGLTEELINALTRVKDLRVIPRSSTGRTTSGNRDVQQLGRDLNVGAVLDGSVRKAGDRIRIAVRVSDVTRGQTLWAEMYERHVSDIFAVQEDIATKIVRSLGAQLAVGNSRQPLTHAHTTSLEAYNLYLKGRYHWNRRGEEALRKAIGFFEQATHEDPRYAAAYSGLADAYGGLAHQGSQAPSDVLPKAKAAALKALEMDRDLPEAYSSLGLIHMFYDWDFPEAERSLKRALEIDPRYAPAYHWYAVLLMLAGRLDEALVNIRLAEEIEPLQPNLKRAVGDLHYRRREFPQAIRNCQEALDLDSTSDSIYICLGRAYEAQGLFDKSIDSYLKGAKVSSRQDLLLALLARVHGVSGNRTKASELLEELRQRARRSYVSPFYLAIATAGLGDKESTLSALQKAVAERSAWVVGLAGDHRFDFMRSDARFLTLLRSLPTLSSPSAKH